MTTVVNNGLRVSRIYSWQIAPFHCFCLSHGVFNLVKFVKIPTQKFESQLNGINPFSVLWESSQSERLLYENFIIKENTLFAAENDKNCSSPGTEFNYLSLGRHWVDSTLLPTERLREIELLFCELSVLLPSWWTSRLSFPTKTWFLPHTMERNGKKFMWRCTRYQERNPSPSQAIETRQWQRRESVIIDSRQNDEGMASAHISALQKSLEQVFSWMAKSLTTGITQTHSMCVRRRSPRVNLTTINRQVPHKTNLAIKAGKWMLMPRSMTFLSDVKEHNNETHGKQTKVVKSSREI